MKSAKGEEEKVFKLKLKGGIPELQTKKTDPTKIGQNAASQIDSSPSK